MCMYTCMYTLSFSMRGFTVTTSQSRPNVVVISNLNYSIKYMMINQCRDFADKEKRHVIIGSLQYLLF